MTEKYAELRAAIDDSERKQKSDPWFTYIYRKGNVDIAALLAERDALREALIEAERVIDLDRDALVACHGIEGEIPVGDILGSAGKDEYDRALGIIRAALGEKP